MARVIRAERTGPNVVRAELHDARAEAAEVIAHARREAAKIREQAFDSARAQAHADLATAWLQVAEARAQAVAQVDRSALEAALLIAGRIVGEALEAKPERIADMLVPLLSRVRRARVITLRVHPGDAETLHAMLSDMIARIGIEGSVDIVADESITRGGCLIESNAGEIDARIETRITEWKRVLDERNR